MAVFGSAFSPSLVSAELRPDQLVILVNENEPESLNVGRHYARQRSVPVSQIVKLDLPTTETMSWSQYQEYLVEPLRKALLAKELAGTTRVIVTTFGVPLRINAPQQSEQEKTWHSDATQWKKSAIEFLLSIDTALNQTLHSLGEAPQSRSLHSLRSDLSKPHKIFKQIHSSIAKIKAHISNRSNSNTQKDLAVPFFKQVLQLDGLSAYATYFRFNHNQIKYPLEQLRNRAELVRQILSVLVLNPTHKNREAAYQLAQLFFGIRGVLQLANAEQEQFIHKDANASLDSELSLLWLDHGEYSPNWRLPNPLYAWNKTNLQLEKDLLPYPILMVSRIDAPTPELARQMIDQAIQAEEIGLSGKVYLDARGLKSKQPLRYGDYDESLRNIAKYIKANTTYPVVLENTEQRFARLGEAPDVALYAGWYRLRHYEDAFSFNPGAIGYHIASGEAISIHNPKEKGWCKNALERGITVTLGPTNEPYLDAFPKPAEFFGLMLSGRFTLVEAFFLSTRNLSWRMVLFGDPLYNPWADISRPKLSDLQQSIPEFRKLDALPIEPSDRLFPNPIQSAQIRKTQRETLLSQIPALLSTNP